MQTIQNAVTYYQAQQSSYPTADGSAPGDVVWSKLLTQTSAGSNKYGPYLQSQPTGPDSYTRGTIDAAGNFYWASSSDSRILY